MVYLPARAVNSTCDRFFRTMSSMPTIEQCLEAGDTPYCWPANGTRICASTVKELPLYWPATFYNPRAFFYVDFGDQHTQGPNQPGEIEVTQGKKELTGWEKHAERISGESWDDEKVLRITIREWYPKLDSMAEAVHQGPTLILVPTPEETVIATPTPSAAPAPNPQLKTGQIIGIAFGALVGLIFVGVILFSCCRSCCQGCCFPEKAETKRVRAAERRRIREEKAYAQPDVNAVKAAVSRGEVWKGPVRQGGMWMSRSDWPASPRRAARPASSGDDEIRAVDVNQEQWMEEQSTELQRIEEMRRGEQRQEEQSVAERRQETSRVEEVEPPGYEAPPPKYTP